MVICNTVPAKISYLHYDFSRQNTDLMVSFGIFYQFSSVLLNVDPDPAGLYLEGPDLQLPHGLSNGIIKMRILNTGLHCFFYHVTIVASIPYS